MDVDGASDAPVPKRTRRNTQTHLCLQQQQQQQQAPAEVSTPAAAAAGGSAPLTLEQLQQHLQHDHRSCCEGKTYDHHGSKKEVVHAIARRMMHGLLLLAQQQQQQGQDQGSQHMVSDLLPQLPSIYFPYLNRCVNLHRNNSSSSSGSRRRGGAGSGVFGLQQQQKEGPQTAEGGSSTADIRPLKPTSVCAYLGALLLLLKCELVKGQLPQSVLEDVVCATEQQLQVYRPFTRGQERAGASQVGQHAAPPAAAVAAVTPAAPSHAGASVPASAAAAIVTACPAADGANGTQAMDDAAAGTPADAVRAATAAAAAAADPDSPRFPPVAQCASLRLTAADPVYTEPSDFDMDLQVGRLACPVHAL